MGKNEPQTFGGTFSGVLYSLVFCLSLTGNTFLLWALLRHEDLRKTTNLFLLQLTISDLLLTSSLPFWAVYHLHEWVFGALACHFAVGAFFLGFYSYMLFLTAMTVDRYIAVVHALSATWARMLRYFKLTSAVLWAISVAASVPEAFFSQTRVSHDGTLCEASSRPLAWELLGYYLQIWLFFLLPFTVILFCYVRIWATISRCRSGKRHRVVRLIFFIVAVFFVCWAPYNIVLFLSSLTLLGWDAPQSLEYAYYVCHSLAYCHCFLNPAFHIFGGGKFWKYLSGRRLSIRSPWSQPSQSSGHRASTSHHTYV
ncbi:C-C chemokine receptor type 4-like [Megalops cyprinoides]|uniref:C-C chemokine receptor type 4-like n=1 Tax=Megalops cyprinoides TaxID=118141 RepID=UPI00186415C2|nr:C-C chemokine receptor type 4-like [Megalops cyprinoides]